MEKAIKVILTILLFACLAHLPYGYYQFVRFVAMIGFAVLAYQAYERSSKKEMIVYVCLAILFQPISKISVGRELWNVIDVITGAGLLISIFFKPKGANEK